MTHSNLEEAIRKVSLDQNSRKTLISDPGQIKKEFNLSNEDIMAMKSYDSLMQTMTPRPTALCCCCFQCDS